MTFEETYKEYYHTIERFCNYQIGYDRFYSEEIADAVFDTLNQKWIELESHEPAVMLTWLYRTAAFKIKEFYRHKPPEMIEYDEYAQSLIEKKKRESVSTIDEAEELLKYEFYKEQIRRTLKAKERELFDCYVAGLTTDVIMEQLNIKENTLKFHSKNLYSKLGVKSRKQLTELYNRIEIRQ